MLPTNEEVEIAGELFQCVKDVYWETRVDGYLWDPIAILSFHEPSADKAFDRFQAVHHAPYFYPQQMRTTPCTFGTFLDFWLELHHG